MALVIRFLFSLIVCLFGWQRFFIELALEQGKGIPVIVGRVPRDLSPDSDKLTELLSDPRVHVIQKPFNVPVNGGRDHQHDQVEFLALVRNLLGVQYKGQRPL